MSDSTGSKHSAPGQALGYVHQVGWALIELIRHGAAADRELRLETIDDVSWHDATGSPLQALQVKHHQGSGSLSDKSVDLWRTIKVWLDDPHLLDPTGPQLVLATTQSVAEGSALGLLGAEGRDVERARKQLDQAAKDSDNDTTATARQAWLKTSESLRGGLCDRLVVRWKQGTADQLAPLVRDALGDLALPLGHRADVFVQVLLGWWWQVAVDLLNGSRRGITRVEAHLRLEDFREQFSTRSLPITIDREEGPTSPDADRERTFSHQLAWIGASDQLLLLAVRDYYRAYAQMQDWVDNRLADMSELQDYERRLVHEWSLNFEFARSKLGPDATEAELEAAGMQLYELVMSSSPALLRTGFVDPFYARGTHHRLADETHVGWHPHFKLRLEQLLGGSAP